MQGLEHNEVVTGMNGTNCKLYLGGATVVEVS